MELLELDVQRGFTLAVKGCVVTRAIRLQPSPMAWPPTPRVEEVSHAGVRVGVCRSWFPEPGLAALNDALMPEAALLHMAAGITSVRAQISALTVTVRPCLLDDGTDLEVSVPISVVAVHTIWCTSVGAVVMHSLARWRADRVRLTVPVSTSTSNGADPCPSSRTHPTGRQNRHRQPSCSPHGDDRQPCCANDPQAA